MKITPTTPGNYTIEVKQSELDTIHGSLMWADTTIPAGGENIRDPENLVFEKMAEELYEYSTCKKEVESQP